VHFILGFICWWGREQETGWECYSSCHEWNWESSDIYNEGRIINVQSQVYKSP